MDKDWNISYHTWLHMQYFDHIDDEQTWNSIRINHNLVIQSVNNSQSIDSFVSFLQHEHLYFPPHIDANWWSIIHLVYHKSRDQMDNLTDDVPILTQVHNQVTFLFLCKFSIMLRLLQKDFHSCDKFWTQMNIDHIHVYHTQNINIWHRHNSKDWWLVGTEW